MPTTSAASAPSRRAIRKEEIKRQVPVANQLQVTKPSLVPPNLTVKAFCRCSILFRRLQYPLMFASDLLCRNSRFVVGQNRTGCNRTGRIGIGRIAIIPLAAILSFLPVCLRAQSPSTVPAESNSDVTSAGTGKARQAYDEGLRAEKAGDWETALQAYQQAAAASPEDRAIRLREQLARSALAQQRTEQAERQLVSGNPALARATLQSAIDLDPSYTVAQERLQQLEQAGASPTLPSDNLASTLPAIKPSAGTRNFDYNGVTHGLYEEVARQFGVIAAFDPELQDRQIRFRVSDVDFDTAMRLLSEQTSTFWF